MQCCFLHSDNSGSTAQTFAHNHSYLDVEIDFVRKLYLGTGTTPLIPNILPFVSWNSVANIESSYTFIRASNGGTEPASIFTNPVTCSVVTEAEVAIIITDGEIDGRAISNFAAQMSAHGNHLKAIIGVIVGRRTAGNGYSEQNQMRPAAVNVSVMAPATTISNSCIIFHNQKESYVVSSYGRFKEEWQPADITETIKWEQLKTVSFEDIANVLIPIHDETVVRALLEQGYVPFGSGVFFHPTSFLTVILLGMNSPTCHMITSVNTSELMVKATK